jgi:hypothetical protein
MMSGKAVAVEVEPDDKLSFVKQEVSMNVKTAVDDQTFICKGNILMDDKTLQEQGVEANETIQLVMPLQVEQVI